MPNNENIHVSDTAFVTCAFRRLNESLSQDYYAKLWYNDKAELILKDYLSKVSTEEVQTHCIRNRYFLEQLKRLITEHKNAHSKYMWLHILEYFEIILSTKNNLDDLLVDNFRDFHKNYFQRFVVHYH